ncbi:MAG: type IV pilus assembly protein PilM [Phycisphaerales bacterium]
MPPSNVCWGIEIGYGAVTALKLQGDGENLQVLDFAVIPHAKTLSTPDLDKDDAMRVALGTLATRFDLSGATIAVSLPGHQSFARFAKLPPVEPKKVPDIVKFEAVQQIPFPLEEVEWDFQTFASDDSPEVEVGIFAVTRKRIMDLLTMLGDVGVTPEIATLSPIAAYNAIAYDLSFTEKSPGTILLDIGTVATDLIIADSGRVWVRTFPIGGHQFTEALVNTFKLSYTKAEKLKKEAEQTKHARHVFQAMRPVFADLVQEVQRSIGYYQSMHPETQLERLIGLGSTFRLPGLRKYLKQQLQLDVYRMEQFKRLNVEGPQAAEFQNASLNLATAYGLALQGIGRGTLQANLMPVVVVREAMWKRKVPWFAAAAGLAAAASGAMFIRPLLDSAAYTGKENPAVIQDVIRDATVEAAEAEKAGVTGKADPDLRADKIVGLLEGRELYAQILADAARMLESADTRAASDEKLAIPKGEPAFRLITLDASYQGPGDDSSGGGGGGGGGGRGAGGYSPDDAFGEGEFGDDSGFGARQGFGGRQDYPAQAQTQTAQDTSLSELEGKRYVRVQMEVETASKYPYVMDLTIVKWLRDRAAAAGADPYSVVVSQSPYVKGATIAAGGSQLAPGGRGGPQRPGYQSDPYAGGPRGSGGPRGLGSGAGSNRSADQIAPLPAPPLDQVERQRYVVTWYAVLDPTTTEAQP